MPEKQRVGYAYGALYSDYFSLSINPAHTTFHTFPQQPTARPWDSHTHTELHCKNVINIYNELHVFSFKMRHNSAWHIICYFNYRMSSRDTVPNEYKDDIMSQNPYSDHAIVQTFDLSGIAHDMRTPLSVISGFLNTVNVGDEEMKEFKRAAKRSLEKVLNLIEEMATLQRKRSSQPSKCDAAALLESTIEAIVPCAKLKNVDIRYTGPTHFICAIEKSLIERAVANLIVNAVQASSEGGEVRVELYHRNDSLLIEVKDNGPGIDPVHLPMIFDRGFTRGKSDGTGIGLNVCKKFVEQHSGSIDVQSRIGEGSVFRITIPDVFREAQAA